MTRLCPNCASELSAAARVCTYCGSPQPAYAISTPAAATVAENTRVIRIGRAPDNDVVLDFPAVSGYHARLLIGNGTALLEDLGSTNGTALGTPENKITRSPLARHELVYFGSLCFPAERLWPVQPAAPARPTKPAATTVPAVTELAFRGETLTLGRAPDCDQVLDFPMISWHHARLTRQAGQVWVEDLGSTNGTYVNHQRIQTRTVLRPGDVVGLGSYTLWLTPAGKLEVRDGRGHLTIEARDVSVTANGRTLLEKVSLTLYPAEITGLMGPSGAGKTTLMTALNGYTPPSSGAVLLNHEDLYANFARFGGQLGYVPQDDIMHGELTVQEALYYTARLRLPSDYSTADINRRIETVLEQLALQDVRYSLIGSPEKRGLSGGQRKRVNVAMELLTDPPALFLDEPTSGLSSEDTLMVMKVLRKLADSGKAILLTIHQPSLDAYRLLDNLIIVSRDKGSPTPGQLAYFGPAYPDAIHFFNPTRPPSPTGQPPTPDEVLRGLGQAPTAEWAKKYATSAYHHQFVTARAGQGQASGTTSTAPTSLRHPGVAQWWTLVQRALRIKLRDGWGTAILLAQAPIIAAFISLVFGKQVNKTVSFDETAAGLAQYANRLQDFGMIAGSLKITIFLLVIAALWFGCANAARELVGERAIYRRERMVNLKIPSYIAAKVTVLGLLCLVQCLVLLGIVIWLCGLRAPWWQLYGVLVLTASVGVGLGLTASALARTSEAALYLTPIILIPMIILGGALLPRYRMNWSGPTQWMASRWGFEAALLLETEKREKAPIFAPEVFNPPPTTTPDSTAALPVSRRDDMAEGVFPTVAHEKNDWAKDRAGVKKSVLALCAMLGVLWLAVPGLLKMREWRR